MRLPRPVVASIGRPVYRLVLNQHLPVSLQRRMSQLVTVVLRPPHGTRVELIRLGARTGERVSYGASHRPRAVVYLHGGGFVVGSARMYRALAGHLARVSGSVVFTLDYRRAPEHPYPAALDDAVAAFRDLVDVHGFDPGRIAIAGDSAGGGLAVSAARTLVDAGLRPGALALLSPWTDPADRELPERDLVLTRAWLAWCAEQYRGTARADDPGYAPMHAPLSGLPPMLIHAGAHELLNTQIARFAERARAAGGDVRLVEPAGLWHSGHLLAGTLCAATRAVHDVGVYLRAHLDGTD